MAGKFASKMTESSDEDVAQVSLLCSGTDEHYVRHDLSITGDVNATINRILDGNVFSLFNQGLYY